MDRKTAVRFLEQYQLKCRIDQFVNDLIGAPKNDEDWPRHEARLFDVIDAVLRSLCTLVGDRENLIEYVTDIADDSTIDWFTETLLVQGTKVPMWQVAEMMKKEATRA